MFSLKITSYLNFGKPIHIVQPTHLYICIAYPIYVREQRTEANMTCGPCGRNFLTADEKAEMLSEYKDSLEKELQGVKERIRDLEKK